MAGASAVDQHCTVLMYREDILSNKSELRKKLESNENTEKIEALKTVILLALNGEPQPNMLMPVIKYCLNSDNHTLKKLLLVYWESVDKTDSSGKLLPEMILVCNAIRNDLQHANEYIRGSTLRLVCKIYHPEILESLIDPITENLKNKHSYVRKNAVLAVFEVFQNFPELIPDAPDMMLELLDQESNIQARRNAFLMLFHCSIDLAAAYLDSQMERLTTFGESFQMVALELIRKMCRADHRAKSRYLRCVFSLLTSSSNTVAYEAANTLLSLSSAPTAVRACISALSMLLTAEGDYNIKLIILDRLESLQGRHEKLLQESLMDIIRVLSTPNIDIRKQVLRIAKRLIAQRNSHNVITVLKKELSTLMSTENCDGKMSESDAQYRSLLLETLFECALKFPDSAEAIVRVLLMYVLEEEASAALETLYFVRGLLYEYSELRSLVLERLVESLQEISASVVFRGAIWIIGEFAEAEELSSSREAIVAALGTLPFGSGEDIEISEESSESVAKSSTPTFSSRPVILEDGTYAQQSSVSESIEIAASVLATKNDDGSKLRSLILEGDFFLSGSVCNALTKLVLRESMLSTIAKQEMNHHFAQVMFVMSSFLRHGTTTCSEGQPIIDRDSIDRITRCIRACLDPQRYRHVFLRNCRESFELMFEQRRTLKLAEDNAGKGNIDAGAEVDQIISIRQLKSRFELGEFGFADDDLDLGKAVGNTELGDKSSHCMDRIFQLTGYSDPVYSEAKVTVHEYDIVLDILVINQSARTLQDLSVELSTSGDLKLVERPQGHTLGPHESKTIQANIKVSSTESGVIFGNIVYDASGLSGKQIVVMSSVHMDIMEYIMPAVCVEADFRSMWAEFEWENKVPVSTEITELDEYVTHITDLANMNCLSDRSAFVGGGCNFLAVNMYARSIFGEDALMNVSVQKQQDTDRIGGYIRIRSKTQGIALSLGDRITSHQRQKMK